MAFAGLSGHAVRSEYGGYQLDGGRWRSAETRGSKRRVREGNPTHPRANGGGAGVNCTAGPSRLAGLALRCIEAGLYVACEACDDHYKLTGQEAMPPRSAARAVRAEPIEAAVAATEMT